MSGKSPEKQFIDVGSNDWAKAEGKSILHTDGLISCTGIMSFYRPRRIGHMFHAAITPRSKDLHDFFESVNETTEDPKKLKFWVRGGSFDEDIAINNALIAETREFVEEKISELGVVRRNLDIVWADPNAGVEMWLDCYNGRFREENFIARNWEI